MTIAIKGHPVTFVVESHGVAKMAGEVVEATVARMQGEFYGWPVVITIRTADDADFFGGVTQP